MSDSLPTPRSGPPVPRRLVTTVLVALLTGVIALTSAVTGAPAASAAPDPQGTTWAGNSPNPIPGGVDYYIDATGGDDGEAGTSPATAWRSLAKASTTTFQPGDRILLRGGETWAGQSLSPQGSGAPDRPITIDAYGDQAAGLPHISTDGVVPSPFQPGTQVKNPQTVGLTGAVNLRNQQYWTIQHLELSNDDDPSTDIVSGDQVRDGVSVSINADLFPAGTPTADTVMHGITVRDLDVHDIDGPNSWQRIYLAGVNFQVFGSQDWMAYGSGGYHFQDVDIRDNTFTTVELNAVQFAFNWFGNGNGTTDATGKFHEGWEQLWVRDQNLYSQDVYIGHNYAEDIGQGVYQFANSRNLLAEYNEGNGWLRRYSGVSAGLYLWAGADSTMRYNEIYGGPAQQYDATPWDLEFTNFNVTYEYNYSHDNMGGWMSYMGNSGNSIARYNLSVNDNGVIWKNMLSSNYSPTYVANNVFVYDGAELDSFHDELLKDRVYFLNNVFYNTSTTTTTTWYTKPGALDRGVFSNNSFYEASGVYSPQQPTGTNSIQGNPQFVGDPATYARDAGVDQVTASGDIFRLQSSSPLIDAGRYNAHLGTEDYFGNGNYYGSAPDIGIQEVQTGSPVTNPVDTDPIENEGIDTRVDLARDKPVTASSSHPSGRFPGNNLTDGDDTNRWASEDFPAYPLTIDVDFGAPTEFDEVDLGEYTDAGTAPRIAAWDLQSWDGTQWVTFASGSGVGPEKVVDGFGTVTSSKLRFSIGGLLPGETYGPTMTEIRVFGPAVVTNPTVTPAVGVYDVNPAVSGTTSNTVGYRVQLDGDTLSSINYVTPGGAVVQSLGAGEYTTSDPADDHTVTLTPAFFIGKSLGASGLRFAFGSGASTTVRIEIVDSRDLVAAIAEAAAVPTAGSQAYTDLQTSLASARALLDATNRTRAGTGNADVTQQALTQATSALRAATAAAGGSTSPGGGSPGSTPTPGGTPTGGSSPTAGGSAPAGGTTPAGGSMSPSAAPAAGATATPGAPNAVVHTASGTTKPGSLPNTGFEAVGGVLLATLLVGVGGIALLVSRRTRPRRVGAGSGSADSAG